MIWNQVLLYSAIPAILMLGGSLLVLLKPPTPKWTSIVQHFAGGVVFAAVAVELLPQVVDQSKWFLSIGFIAGVALMIAVDQFSGFLNKNQTSKTPLGLIVSVGIDVLIDGILIGVAFLVNVHSGILIALALSLEVLFLGLSTNATLLKRKITLSVSVMISIALALLIPVGASLGYGLVSQLPKSGHLMILSFGVAALLYLVTEELLKEAHEIEEVIPATAAFFLGFLVILLTA